MLIFDVSNVIHSGVSNGSEYLCGTDYSRSLRGIPYLFDKVANYAIKNPNLVLVFDPDKEGKFQSTSQFQTKRVHRPQVVWELRVLKRLMQFVGVPAIEVPGYSADSLIYSIMTDAEDMPEDHFILSADQDIACNVRQRGQFTTSMLGFNAHSYNINPSNFAGILGVPYNFINIHKLLMGCQSDGIPVYRNGRKLWREYIEYLELMMSAGSLGEEEEITNFDLVYDTFEYNTEESFFDWLHDTYNTYDGEAELRERASYIFPKYCRITFSLNIDWSLWNAVSRYLFRLDPLQARNFAEGELTEAQKVVIDGIIDTTPFVRSTTFVPDSMLEIGGSEQDLSDLDIFGKEEL